MSDWEDSPDDLPIEPGEAFRWLYRHQACLNFDVGDDGRHVVILGVPLRHPEGEIDQSRQAVRSHGRAMETVLELIPTTRDRLNLE